MPKMGESIMEATVLKWLKKEGDQVARDEAVLEIATDKVDSEVPTPVGGRLVQLLHGEGAVVKVGAVLAVLEDGAAASEQVPAPQASRPQSPPPPVATTVPVHAPELLGALQSKAAAPAVQAGRFYSPLVLNIARQEGIPMAELDNIPGTGDQGRLTKKDLLAYLQHRGASASSAAVLAGPATSESESVSWSVESESRGTAAAETFTVVNADPAPLASEEKGLTTTGSVEIIEMDRMRRMIAENMVASKRISAHVTSFVEADVTNLHYWREAHKSEFEKRFGEKLTFTPMFVEAVVKAIQDFPMINVSVDGQRILRHKDINIGMAAALPSGNLIVPVIHHADQLNLVGLTKRVNDLAQRARLGKLKPEEIQGGTFTLSNVGTFGNVMGTPIIAQPQVAILAVGAVRKRPAVIETPQGDFIGIRHMMFLSHSYDHRVVDGALGGQFVKRVAEYLEKWDSGRGIS